MRIGNLNHAKGIFLAPLAGVSNRAFRLLARGFGADMTVTEMVSADGLVQGQQKTANMARFGDDERPVAVQIFGADPVIMRDAAAIVAEAFRPDMIDINLGCPVKKVVRKNGGAALLKDLDLTADIIGSVICGAGKTPVSIKIRCGWSTDSPVYLELGQAAQSLGVAAITLHARARSDGFSGEADWSAIAKLKECLEIPVIGNGDIRTAGDVVSMFEETGCDAVMIGRAAMSNPLIFRQAKQLLAGQEPAVVTFEDVEKLSKRHARLLIAEFGEGRAMRKMRRHLGRYISGWPHASQLRQRLLRVSTYNEMTAILAQFRRSIPKSVARADRPAYIGG